MVKEFDGDKALKEAKEELERLYASPEDTAEYRVREKRLEDHYAMLMSMRREGRAESHKQVVLKMYNKHMKIEEICDIVELSKEDVEKIISENKQI